MGLLRCYSVGSIYQTLITFWQSCDEVPTCLYTIIPKVPRSKHPICMSCPFVLSLLCNTSTVYLRCLLSWVLSVHGCWMNALCVFSTKPHWYACLIPAGSDVPPLCLKSCLHLPGISPGDDLYREGPWDPLVWMVLRHGGYLISSCLMVIPLLMKPLSAHHLHAPPHADYGKSMSWCSSLCYILYLNYSNSSVRQVHHAVILFMGIGHCISTSHRQSRQSVFMVA